MPRWRSLPRRERSSSNSASIRATAQSQERARALSPRRAKLVGAPHTPIHSSLLRRRAASGLAFTFLDTFSAAFREETIEEALARLRAAGGRLGLGRADRDRGRTLAGGVGRPRIGRARRRGGPAHARHRRA